MTIHQVSRSGLGSGRWLNDLKTRSREIIPVVPYTEYELYTSEYHLEYELYISHTRTAIYRNSFTEIFRLPNNKRIHVKTMYNNESSEESAAVAYEKLHVHNVYQDIAHHFSNTRYKTWPLVEKFIVHNFFIEKPEKFSVQKTKIGIPSESGAKCSDETFCESPLWIDIGCGNGKNIPHFDSHYISNVCADSIKFGARFPESFSKYEEQNSRTPRVIGVDYCSNWLSMASKQDIRRELCVGNALHLPFRSGTFEGGICIAVLHHISTKARRLQLLREAGRVLRKGSALLLYAWAFEQKKRITEDQDTFIPWMASQKQLGNNSNKEEAPLISGENVTHKVRKEPDKGPPFLKKYLRYCHLYKKGELESLLAMCGDLFIVEKTYYDNDNWCAVVRRI